LRFPGADGKWVCVLSDWCKSSTCKCPDNYFLNLGGAADASDAPQVICVPENDPKCRGIKGVAMDTDKSKKFPIGKCEKSIHCLRQAWDLKKNPTALQAALSTKSGSAKTDLQRIFDEQDAYCWRGECKPKKVSSAPEAGRFSGSSSYKECAPDMNDTCQSGVCRKSDAASGKCVDGYPDSGMGVSAHCHNRLCDSDTCDDGTTKLVQEFSAPAKSRQSRALLGHGFPAPKPVPPPPPPRNDPSTTFGENWLPTKWVRPCHITKAECKKQIYLFREKCYWKKRKIASACDHKDQCAPHNGKSHCVYPWGWTTGTCSQCEVHGDCESNHYCKQSGSTAGSMTSFNANRKRNLCVPQFSTGSSCGNNIECKTGKCEGWLSEGLKCSECTGGCKGGDHTCSTSVGCPSGTQCMGKYHGGRTCKSPLSAGSHCEAAKECSSGLCKNWKCAECEGGCLSGSCSSSIGCRRRRVVCQGGSHHGRTCKAKLGYLQGCQGKDECASGICRDWKCRQSAQWSSCWEDNDCKNGYRRRYAFAANRRRRRGVHARDDCIKASCKRLGRNFNGNWKDCGSWKYAGQCD